jgi:hypothetical protein
MMVMIRPEMVEDRKVEKKAESEEMKATQEINMRKSYFPFVNDKVRKIRIYWITRILDPYGTEYSV